MKKVFCLLILLTLGVARTLCAGDAIRLAVLEFENNTGRADVEHLKKGLRDFFVTDLQGVSGVTLVERGRIDEVLKEIKMTQSKYFDQATAAKIGKQMGASHILTGSYLCLNKKWRMDIRVVATATGEILVTGKQEGSEDDVFDMEKALVEAMAKKLKPDLSRRELRKINQVQTEKFSSFDKYSRAVDKAERGDAAGAVKLREEGAREDKSFSLAADQLEKYRAKLLADIERHVKSSKETSLSDREYVEQDFRNALERRKIRDSSPDYYVALMVAALHYGLRNRNHEYDREIAEITREYDIEFLCKKHSVQLLQKTYEKLDVRLKNLQEKIFQKDTSSSGWGMFMGSIAWSKYEKQFKDYFTKKNPFEVSYGGVHLYWPLSSKPHWNMWVLRSLIMYRNNYSVHCDVFNSMICSLCFIFNHDPSKIISEITPDINDSWSRRFRKRDASMKIESGIRRFIESFENKYIVGGNGSKDVIFMSIIKYPHSGIDNWADVVIKALHGLEQYETDEDKKVAIKQALVYAIDAKKQKDNAR